MHERGLIGLTGSRPKHVPLVLQGIERLDWDKEVKKMGPKLFRYGLKGCGHTDGEGFIPPGYKLKDRIDSNAGILVRISNFIR